MFIDHGWDEGCEVSLRSALNFTNEMPFPMATGDGRLAFSMAMALLGGRKDVAAAARIKERERKSPNDVISSFAKCGESRFCE